MVEKKGNGISFDFTAAGTRDIGLQLSGLFDVQNESKNEINAFLNIMGSSFPLLKQVTNPDFKIGETYKGCIDAIFSDICWELNWEFYIGWYVVPQGVDEVLLNITYVPYGRLELSGNADSSTILIRGNFDVDTTLFYSTLPITMEVNFVKNSLCYQADFYYYPPAAILQLGSAVKECFQDVEAASRTGDYHWECGYNTPLNITLFNSTNPVPQVTNFLERTCWTRQ